MSQDTHDIDTDANRTGDDGPQLSRRSAMAGMGGLLGASLVGTGEVAAEDIEVDGHTRQTYRSIADVDWLPGREDVRRRETLAQKAAGILRAAGATEIHRSDMVPFMIHIHGTMALGKVTDAGGEAKDVDRLFIADHSVIPNGLGGQNPTHTGQAMALRTADHAHERYLDS